MSKNIKLTIDALPTTSTGLGFDDNKLVVKISKTANNGLSIVNGKLVATKAPDGTPGGGTMNLPGNAIGPTTASSTTALGTVGLNKTVSRKQKAGSNQSQFVKDSDGPVMTKVSNGSLVSNKSIASYMIRYNQENP